MDNASAKEMLVDAKWYAETLHKLVEVGMKEEKYLWHDLRKNPDDLPEEGEKVLVFAKALGHINMLHNDAYTVTWRRGDNFVGFETIMQYQIVAWKEIEPFEEENNV